MLLSFTNPLSDPSWDASVSHFDGASVFHGQGWARVLQGTYGFTPFYVSAQENDRLVGVLPLMEVRSPLTGTRGVSLPFTDDCDPLADTPEIRNALVAQAHTLAKTRHWKYLELRTRPPSSTSQPLNLSTSQPLNPSTFLSHRTALSASDADFPTLLKRIHDSTRRAVKKAQREGVLAEVRTDAAAIDTYYDLHCLARKGHGLPPQTRGFFRRIHRELISQNQGFVVLATHNGRPLAGAVYLLLGGLATYKFGASDTRFLHLRPNHLVMATAMAHAASLGYTSFDFGRTSLWNEGLRFYKTRWASTESQLAYTRFSPSSGETTPVADGAKGAHTRFFQRLPITASRLIGAVLYKHMA
ncbi:lipid II:glycine glycyltransferase FemX [Nibricoccus sp. IMCC34717]|uniref:lipid II:glycine glycyltransferase FemX n=1 Tax=Nibricoccus sp. IMCC34717 TaxID=3034021 RepID=UPI00384D7458